MQPSKLNSEVPGHVNPSSGFEVSRSLGMAFNIEAINNYRYYSSGLLIISILYRSPKPDSNFRSRGWHVERTLELLVLIVPACVLVKGFKLFKLP